MKNINEISSILLGKKPPVIGLDIGSSSVKIVAFDGDSPANARLANYAINSIPPDYIVDGNVANIEGVAEIIKKVIMPPAKNDDELELQVRNEANQYIPFNLDEVNIDYQVLGTAETSPSEIEVLIVAARKDKVDERLALVEQAGLNPLILDVDGHAQRNSLSLLLDNKDLDENIIALIDISGYAVHLTIFRKGEVVYTREARNGGFELTQSISQQFGVSLTDAEENKRAGKLPEEYNASVLEPFMDSLCAEVYRSLQFFLTTTSHNHIDKIVLCGGSASLPGLDRMLARTISATISSEVLIARPLSNLTKGDNVAIERITRDEPGLLLACGLAMRKFW